MQSDTTLSLEHQGRGEQWAAGTSVRTQNRSWNESWKCRSHLKHDIQSQSEWDSFKDEKLRRRPEALGGSLRKPQADTVQVKRGSRGNTSELAAAIFTAIISRESAPETGTSVHLFWVIVSGWAQAVLELTTEPLKRLFSCLTLLGPGITGVSFHAQPGPCLFCFLINPVATLLI